MNKISVWFIRMALIYFIIAASMGVLMLTWPWWTRTYIPGHAHLNLLGWVSMTLYGLLYHVVPKHSGRPLYSKKLGWAHFYVANIGVWGMVLYFGFVGHGKLEYGEHLLYSAYIELLSTIIFVFNMMMTIRVVEEKN